jgi:hypothetical protein
VMDEVWGQGDQVESEESEDHPETCTVGRVSGETRPRRPPLEAKDAQPFSHLGVPAEHLSGRSENPATP